MKWTPKLQLNSCNSLFFSKHQPIYLKKVSCLDEKNIVVCRSRGSKQIQNRPVIPTVWNESSICFQGKLEDSVFAELLPSSHFQHGNWKSYFFAVACDAEQCPPALIEKFFPAQVWSLRRAGCYAKIQDLIAYNCVGHCFFTHGKDSRRNCTKHRMCFHNYL